MNLPSWQWMVGLQASITTWSFDEAKALGVILAREVLQDTVPTGADVTGAANGYVLAAYMVTAVLIVGYGLSLWWRVRGARADLATWQGAGDSDDTGDGGG